MVWHKSLHSLSFPICQVCVARPSFSECLLEHALRFQRRATPPSCSRKQMQDNAPLLNTHQLPAWPQCLQLKETPWREQAEHSLFFWFVSICASGSGEGHTVGLLPRVSDDPIGLWPAVTPRQGHPSAAMPCCYMIQ